MKLGICTQARKENVYINDWVKYHLTHGYDHIWIYDDNPVDYQYVGDCIDKNYIDRVTIIDVRGKKSNIGNTCVYSNQWIKEYSKEVDWCTFIDIDEFVVSPDIKALLASMPDNCYSVVLNWKLYGDDNILIGNESIPIYERISKSVRGGRFYKSNFVKSTIRCDRHIIDITPHIFLCTDKSQIICNCKGERAEVRLNESIKVYLREHYIAHYVTKTLGEFLKYKFDNIRPSWGKCHGITKLDYFFDINKITPEKIDMLYNFIHNNYEIH